MNKCPIVSRVTLIIPVPINRKISYPRTPIQPILILIAITLVNCARTRITYVNSALAEFVIFIFSTYSARSPIPRLLRLAFVRPRAGREFLRAKLARDSWIVPFAITNHRYLKYLQFNHFAHRKISRSSGFFHHLVSLFTQHPLMQFPSSFISSIK